MSDCKNELRAAGKAYPRTCPRCGLGPCQVPLPGTKPPTTTTTTLKEAAAAATEAIQRFAIIAGAAAANAAETDRTDEEIIEQTNALALEFLRIQGWEYVLPVGTDSKPECWQSLNPRVAMAWQMACAAQMALTLTDPTDALDNLWPDETDETPTPES